MARYKMLIATIFLAILAASRSAELPRPSFARTMLKVSRSLPGETEEVKVRTSEGNLATLIVRRRDKSTISNDLQTPKNSGEQSQGLSDAVKAVDEIQEKKDEVKRFQEEAQIEKIRSHFAIEPEERSDNETKRSRKSEKFSLPEMKYYRTTDKAKQEEQIEYGNWTPLGDSARALLREDQNYPDWKPVQSNQKTTTEERTNYARFESLPYREGDILVARNFDNRQRKNLGLEELNSATITSNEGTRYAFLPHQPRPLTRTNIGANLQKNRDAKNVPSEVTIRSEINVKAASKRSPMTLDADGTPVIHGKRVPDEPIDKIQTWRNARVSNNKLIPEDSTTVTINPSSNFYLANNLAETRRFESFFENVNRRYGRDFDDEGRNVYFEWDPSSYRNEGLKAEVYETKNENVASNLQKRMLQPDKVVSSYPNSQLYTPESQKIAPVALKTGIRAPVLQYAHPELGVQPAKIVKNEKRQQESFKDSQQFAAEQRQKKKYVLNDKNIVDSYVTKNYYPNQHFYGLKRPNDEPFWVKISENLRNQFSTGVEKVSQLTRPVFDPLVEATHKISKNLGLSHGQEAQDKVGTVASGSSILIPALGLVASGAALGIGAVAVGRYLDVDVLKRSSDDEMELEHKRALESSLGEGPEVRIIDDGRYEVLGGIPSPYPIDAGSAGSVESREDDAGVYLVLEEPNSGADRIENRQTKPIVDETDYAETGRRRRRSLDDLDVFKAEPDDMQNLVRSKRLFLRRRVDDPSITADIVEIDVPANGDIDVTELLVSEKKDHGISKSNAGTILVVEDGSQPLKMLEEEPNMAGPDGNAVENVAKIIGDLVKVDETLRKASKPESTTGTASASKTRTRRSTDSDLELEDAFQNLENAEVSEAGHVAGDWTNTPCAKRIFCDAMIQREPDASMFMEKKMASLLSLIQPGAAAQVSSHFEEVMEAVRRHDCSSFLCPQARPGNVFF